ncbi:hypothetical protein ACIQ2D_21580 [Lysinibacillus sp. NPDC097287]|uniref:hypothetical protein n=1 Tax=Lysinibacillus sp. NPDC097287 TaxID=3364144 RepID=UPI003825EA83
MEPITSKQEKFLKYLVCKVVDYGRRLYIMGNAKGYVVPVLLPNDYDFEVCLVDMGKVEAGELIGQLIYAKDNDGDLSRIDKVIAEKVELDNTDLTLTDFLFGKRVIVGIELCE